MDRILLTINHQRQMAKSDPKKAKQRIMTIASGLIFLGSMTFGAVGMLFRSPPPQNPAKQQSQQPDRQLTEGELRQQETNYAAIVAREPKNSVALVGLVKARLALKEYQSAIAPMKTLVEISPERPEYKELLAAIEKEAKKSETTSAVPDTKSDAKTGTTSGEKTP